MKIEVLGEVLEMSNDASLFDVAKQLDNKNETKIAKNAVAAKVNGTAVDMTTKISDGDKIEYIMRDTEEGEEVLRHSTAHMMAQAVIRLWPGTKVAIGPAIENGFYYDFDPPTQFTPEDLPKIEAEMKKIAKENIKIERIMMTREEAIEYFEKAHEPYKVEIIRDIAKGEMLSFYKQGDFIDLCRGPHVPSTGYLKAFKLRSVAGAYWRGDSNNKMLQRIYGYAFDTKEKLDTFLEMLKEAEKRDHRKLGKEMELFFLSEFGPGLPFWLPNGYALRRALIDFWIKLHEKNGYMVVETPIMLSKELWETSGHWDHYKEDMYITDVDETQYAIKPMNCPGAILVYKNGLHSYKDLPIRVAELGHVHRHEASGALAGLFRVRTFTQDDAHTLITEDQVGAEVSRIISIYDYMYSVFGLDYSIELSTRPVDNFIGEVATWDKAEADLAAACRATGRDFKINPGDGAFYGPKLDFKLRDSMNRIWQCGTVQLDMQLPGRFDCTYVAEDGSKKCPVMIHRAGFGSLERFIAIITEHLAGKFPMWLAPVQVKILTMNDDVKDYAEEIKNMLDVKNIRTKIDDRQETIGYKVREANGKYKVPVQVIVGNNEVANRQVSLRYLGSKDQITMSLDEFMTRIVDEAKLPEIKKF